MPSRNFYPNPTYDYPKDIVADTLELNDLGEQPEPNEYLLYNVDGELYWNGTPIVTGTGYWQPEAGVGPNIYYALGYVGIGKTSASYPLDVHGVIKTDDNVILANDKQLQLQDTLGGLTAYIYRDTSNNLVLVNATAAKDIQLTTAAGGGVAINRSLKILESTGGTYYTIIQAGNQSADITYTLPTAQTAVAGYVLGNDGTGVLSWMEGGQPPGDPDTSVQFNDGGNFAGDAQFTFDKTVGQVSLAPTGGDTALDADGDIVLHADKKLIFNG